MLIILVSNSYVSLQPRQQTPFTPYLLLFFLVIAVSLSLIFIKARYSFYRYLHYPVNKTVYPFGWGLSYSEFEFTWEDATKDTMDSTSGRRGTREGATWLETTTDFTALELPAVRVKNIGKVRSSVTVNG